MVFSLGDLSLSDLPLSLYGLLFRWSVFEFISMIVSIDHHRVNEDSENGEALDYLCSLSKHEDGSIEVEKFLCTWDPNWKEIIIVEKGKLRLY